MFTRKRILTAIMVIAMIMAMTPIGGTFTFAKDSDLTQTDDVTVEQGTTNQESTPENSSNNENASESTEEGTVMGMDAEEQAAAMLNQRKPHRAPATGDENISISITSVSLQHDNGGDVEIDSGDDPSDYSDGLNYRERFGFSFEWKLIADHPIQDGDTLIIPISYPNLGITNTSQSNLVNSAGTVIGTWQKQGNNIVFIFNENAGNSTNWSGKCKTGISFLRQASKEFDEVRTFTIGDKTIKYKAIKAPLAPMATNIAAKTAGSASDHLLSYNINLGMDVESKLTDPQNSDYIKDKSWGEANIQHHDVFIEDALDVKNARVTGIYSPIHYPLSDDDSHASNGVPSAPSIINSFVKLEQNRGESLEDFRARVKSAELQYGIYDDNGKSYVMVYLGDWPNSKIKYNLDAVKDNTSDPVWTDGRKQLWLEKHALDNCIDGAVTRIRIGLNFEYAPVIADTQISNTATIEYEGGSIQRSAKNTLKKLDSIAHPEHGSAVLYKFDVDEKHVIEGATFKLQRKNSSNVWEDWKTNIEETSWTTDDTGKIEVSGLINGEYRFVETNPAEGYVINSNKFYGEDMSTELEETHFTISNASGEGALIYCSNEKEKFGDIIINKKLDGNDVDSGKNTEFEFYVTAEEKDGTKIAGTYGAAEFIDGKSTVKITGENTVKITGLPNGTVYTITEKDYTSSDGYEKASWDIEPTNKTIKGANPASVVTYNVTNTKNTYGTLAVSKTVEGNAADGEKKFDFVVTLKDKDGSALSNAEFGMHRTNANGEIKFQLKDGDSEKITDIPNGTQYTVDEDADGYNATKKNDSGTIEGNKEVTATFTNTKNSYGTLEIKKTVGGNAGDKNKAFNFSVTLTDKDDAALANVKIGNYTTNENGIINITLKDGETRIIKDIPNGTKYEVIEDENGQDGYITTTSENTSGTIVGGDDAKVTVTFTNTKNVTLPTKVDPPVTKVVEGTDKTDAFTYTLTAESNTAGIDEINMPMPKDSKNGKKQITKKGSGKYEFGDIEITKEGQYIYKIIEEAGDLSYDYDNTVYYVIYEVTEDNYQLYATTTFKKSSVDGETVDNVVFTNKYNENLTEVFAAEKSDSEEDEDAPKTVKTSDTYNITPWLAILLASAAFLGAMGYRRRQSR